MVKGKGVFLVVSFLLVGALFIGLFCLTNSFSEENFNEEFISEEHFFSTPILIKGAKHYSLRENTFQDVFSQVRSLDGIYSPRVYSGDKIEVEFIENLTKENDFKINIFNPSNSSFLVEIYESNTNFKVGEFNEISSSGEYKTYLLELEGEADSFYLKFYSFYGGEDYLLVDYITDPITGGTTTGGLRPQTVICTSEGSTTACQGTYPAGCTTGDYLSCNDANEETHSTRKAGVASVEGTYFDTGVTNCVSVDKVEACYRWRSSNANPDSCYFNFDESGDGYSGIFTTCPTTTEVSSCIDITPNDIWTCSNFFGTTGSRAKLILGASSSANPSTLVYFDEMWYNVTYTAAGSIDVSLDNPITASVTEETINELFILNATVQCSGNTGEVCGDVTAMARYNSTGALPDTQISSTSGTNPFFANTGNQTCSKLNATTGEDTCTVSWEVNATELGSYEIDVLFTSEYPVISNNDTLDAQVRILNPPLLSINLTSPLSDPGISEGQSFDVDCTASCEYQDCENVLVTLLFCSDSLSCTPTNVLDTLSFGLSSNLDSINLGSLTRDTSENATFSVTGNIPNDYVLSCNATSSNAGSPFSSYELPLNVNDYPVASFFYPAETEWLHGTEILNGSASTDSDGTIVNYKFEIDDNIGFTSSTTICDSASPTCSLDTLTQSECGQESSTCYLKLNVTDDDGTFNSTYIQIGIDNIGPNTTIEFPTNFSYINTESQFMNSSVSEIGSGTSCVEFDLYYDGSWNSLNVDCASPYNYTWDLSGVSDQEFIEIRSRANDSEGNFGSYDYVVNLTHDTVKPIAISDSPLENEIINTTNYLLNATSSYDSTSKIKNASWYYFNSTDSSWDLIGSDLIPEDGLTYNWNINLPDGIYEIRVNVSDNASLENFTTVQNVVIDVQNLEPYCVINFPKGGEELNGQVEINVGAYEDDPSDNVVNATFEYSTNGGSSWNFIGSNLTFSLNEYTYLWDSESDLDSNQYYIRCNVSDSRGSIGTNISSSNFTIDNTPPLISGESINVTNTILNSPVCLNATVTDNLVGVNSVIAELDVPTGPNQNLTLLDDGSSCDLVSGDNVYSKEYIPIFSGTYNWTKTYAYDNLNNLNFTNPGIELSVTANSYLISSLISPLVDFEINESFPFNDFTVECNITCNASGADCDGVGALVEYNPSGFTPITTLTTDLVNDEDFYDCGNLLSGENCIHTFNITAGENSGGNSWDLRCSGSSTNAAADVSVTTNVHVNDYPVAEFFYPAETEWLSGIEILNGSASTDSDGTIVNYKFEIDDNLGFTSSTTICDSASPTCSLDTLTQSECGQESSTCYLRLNVTDDDGTFNSTYIQIGIDNIGPNTTIEFPINFSYINTESQFMNSSIVEIGSGVSCVEFDLYYDGSWNSLNVDCTSPYNYTWDLSEVSDQEFIEIRSRANDSEGNFGSYDYVVNLTHDTNSPNFVLSYPEPFQILGSQNQWFNFTATDNIDNILDCSLILDSEVNSTSTFSSGISGGFYVLGISEGEHEWRINCTDDATNTNNSETRNFTIDLSAPVVNLNLPEDSSWLDSQIVTFSYTPSDPHLDSCEIWGNWSSGWHLNESENVLNNGSSNLVNKNILDGEYIWNVWCNDSVGNSAFSSINYSFGVDTIHPQIFIENSTNKNNSVSSDTWIFLNVSVIENNLDSVFFSWNGVNESFQNSQDIFYWENKTGLSDGDYYFRAYSNDSAGNLNFTDEFNFIVDTVSPNWSNLNQTVEGVYSETYHRGDLITLTSSFNDSVGLNSSWLSTNETGSWQNVTGFYSSPQNLTGSVNTSSFNWSNSSVEIGEDVFWRIYSEDLAGNTNVTDYSFFKVWGWSEIGDIYFFPDGIPVDSSTEIGCLVRDNVSLEPLNEYNVSFYNETGYIGTNTTGIDGYATYNITMNSQGSYDFTCNITDDSSKHYNASQNNFAQKSLGVGFLLSTYDYTNTTTNKAYEGTTDTTTTEINEPYTALENDNGVYQTFEAGQGLFAYTRFEFKIYESPNSIMKMNITWNGFGNIGAGSPGYILYLYNVTSGTWKQEASYSTDATEQMEFITYEDDFGDFIDSNGYVKVLARSFSSAPTTGAGGNRWVNINTDYIKVDIYKDILPPTVELISPEDGFYSSTFSNEFTCHVYDDYLVENVSFYSNWSNGWHLNETNSTEVIDSNFTFTKTLEDGSYVWNCFACDRAGNCQSYNVNNYTLMVDSTPPEVNLIYPFNWQNFTGYDIPFFNFSVTDNGPVEKCELYGDWNNLWHLNQTYNSPTKETLLNFSGITVEGDEFYSWNVNCTDEAGNSAFNSTNFTFSAFLPPLEPLIYNITQSANDGTGDVTLYWNSSNHTYEYEVYSSENMTDFSLLGKTFSNNYTDTTFSGNKRRFYHVLATNPIGNNFSTDYFGVHVYSFKHDGVSAKNLIGFPTNFSLNDANETYNEINGAVSIATLNFSTQERVVCNDFLCPETFSCTETACNFKLEEGKGYEVEVNTSEGIEVNWSGVGVVNSPATINYGYNDPNILKNKFWISLPASTNLETASELFTSIGNVDAVTMWNEFNQTSVGLIGDCVDLPWFSGCFTAGTDFDLEIEKGYEVSSNAVGTWNQE